MPAQLRHQYTRASCRIGPRSRPRPSAPSAGGRSGSTSFCVGAHPGAKGDEDPAAAVEAPKGDGQGHILPRGDEKALTVMSSAPAITSLCGCTTCVQFVVICVIDFVMLRTQFLRLVQFLLVFAIDFVMLRTVC